MNLKTSAHSPRSFCLHQARQHPLGETRHILEEQFRELNETLARLLREATAHRRSKRPSPSSLRKQIETMLGNWSWHEAVGAVHSRRLARSPGLEAIALEWALKDGVKADGILLRPRAAGKRPAIVYASDCSESPEALVGGTGASADGPLRLASRGFSVLVVRSISRTHSGKRHLNNRRYLHRLGWQLGRPFLGAEVSKLRSAIGMLAALPQVDPDRIGVFGFDQGGQLALLAAALDPRIRATVVSNCFGAGAHPEWQPVDRLLFGEAHLFGEPQLARLIGPHRLCVEADPRGRWPTDADARTETEREAAGFTRQVDFETARRMAEPLGVKLLATSKPCCAATVNFLSERLACGTASRVGRGVVAAPTLALSAGAGEEAELRRFAEMENHFHRLLTGAKTRRRSRTPTRQVATKSYFDAIGRFPRRSRVFEARWKLVLNLHRFEGYELTLSVYNGLHTYGVLLVPKDIRPGERRPAVVCQHGFEGEPFYTVGFDTREHAKAYSMLGATLAERGYVVFCPYLCVPNSEQRTRLVKKAWLLGGMPIGLETEKFSRAVDFLESLPFVDRNRIGFYGLSYGGYTALWFTPAEPRFKAVVCSGHFNDWQRKTTDLSFSLSCYLYHPDEDMYNFGLLERMDHTDLATLRAPRPFAVEAGTRDAVFKIEWVRNEFRRVKTVYRRLGAREKAQLYEFDGPHQVCGEKTYPFLDRWLRHHPSTRS